MDPFQLKIVLPRKDWHSEKLAELYDFVQKFGSVLGFTHKASITDMVRANNDWGLIWAAYAVREGQEDQLVGFSQIGSRRDYRHLIRHGSIAVLPEYRRHRIGTALYLAETCQALVEGRRILEDTIIPFYSPMMAEFLTGLGYAQVGALPRRTSGFKDVNLWQGETTNVTHLFRRLTEQTSFHLMNIELQETIKTRASLERNLQNYQVH